MLKRTHTGKSFKNTKPPHKVDKKIQYVGRELRITPQRNKSFILLLWAPRQKIPIIIFERENIIQLLNTSHQKWRGKGVFLAGQDLGDLNRDRASVEGKKKNSFYRRGDSKRETRRLALDQNPPGVMREVEKLFQATQRLQPPPKHRHGPVLRYHTSP